MLTDTGVEAGKGMPQSGHLAKMTSLVEEPRLSVDSLRLLNQFQDAFRSRIYNLIEDHVRETGDRAISRDVLQKLIERALREYCEQMKQKVIDFNG